MRAILTGEATLLLSVLLALQYEAVLTRPEQLAAAGATVEEATALLDVLLAVCRPVEISFLWRPILRDANDEMVPEVAVNGRADRLLSFNERDFAGWRRPRAPPSISSSTSRSPRRSQRSGPPISFGNARGGPTFLVPSRSSTDWAATSRRDQGTNANRAQRKEVGVPRRALGAAVHKSGLMFRHRALPVFVGAA